MRVKTLRFRRVSVYGLPRRRTRAFLLKKKNKTPSCIIIRIYYCKPVYHRVVCRPQEIRKVCLLFSHVCHRLAVFRARRRPASFIEIRISRGIFSRVSRNMPTTVQLPVRSTAGNVNGFFCGNDSSSRNQVNDRFAVYVFSPI